MWTLQKLKGKEGKKELEDGSSGIDQRRCKEGTSKVFESADFWNEGSTRRVYTRYSHGTEWGWSSMDARVDAGPREVGYRSTRGYPTQPWGWLGEEWMAGRPGEVGHLAQPQPWVRLGQPPPLLSYLPTTRGTNWRKKSSKSFN